MAAIPKNPQVTDITTYFEPAPSDDLSATVHEIINDAGRNAKEYNQHIENHGCGE